MSIRRWLAERARRRAEDQRFRRDLDAAYWALVIRVEKQRRAWYRGEGPRPVHPFLPGEIR